MSVPCRPWKTFAVLAAGALLLAATPALAQTHLANPFAGATMYVNPDYTAKANAEAAKQSDSTLAARMRLVGQQPQAVWMDRISAVPSLATHLDQALAQSANLFLGVVYDLPGRDCHALASNGELPGTIAGLNRYKAEYIDAIAATASLAKYSGIRIVFVVEPDSLPNLVTNQSDPDCAAATASQTGAPDGIYREGIRYAVNKLHAIPNVYLYIDSGHSGWLGWPENFDKWITEMDLVARGFTAGKNAIDGFVDDTANTLPTKEPFLSPGMTIGGQDIKSSKFLDWNPYPDEQSFSAELYRRFVAAGWPSGLGLLLDTSRNGWGGSARPTAASTSTDVNTYVNASKVDRRAHRGLWCNPLGAGIGEFPKGAPSDWPSAHYDAYVWVKPPGESDGASKEIPNDQGKGFDRMCDPTYTTDYGVLTGATPDAPLSGDFFPAQFKTLVQNIYPIPGSGPVCQSLPGAPTSLAAAQVSGSEIRLTWTGVTAPTNCTVTYTVHRGTTYNFTPSTSTQVATGLSGSPYSVTGLTPNTTYYFLVQAVDALGAVNSSYVQQNTPNGYTLTVTKAGTGASGGTVTGGGINCGTSCSVVTNPSVTVTLTASVASGTTFSGWAGDCTGSANTCVVNMSMSRSVTANFTSGGTTTNTLTVTTSGNGAVTSSPAGISCGTTCSASFASTATVTLTAAPSTGASFSGWSGACSGTSLTCSVSMSAARSVTATFTGGGTTNNTLTVTTSGNGAVTSSPSGISCGTTCSASFASTTTVTLTAAPSTGASFSGWSGACSGSSLTCTVAMSAARSVTATFTGGGTTNNTLSVTVSGAGSVTSSPAGISNCGTSCSASFPSTTTVTLTATPGGGATFSGWSGACSGTALTCTVAMSAARSVTATFGGTSTPCSNPITFTGNTNNFNTTGAVCYRTTQTINGWGCYNMDGRTITVGGATRTCGQLPLTKASDGYTYFAVTAGTYSWAGIYVY